MFLFFAVIAAALVVAVIVGGDVRRLSHIRVQHPELLIGAFGLKIVVALLGLAQSELVVNIARPLNIVGAALLLAVVWFNRRIPGALLFGAGLALNLAAIVSYAGRMPVVLPRGIDPLSARLAALRNGLDPLHVLLPQPYGPWFIGDIFSIPSPIGRSSLVSIGDILMAAGIVWLIVQCSQRVPSPSHAADPPVVVLKRSPK